ncbi:hypothetical protein F511_47704 [Dorcoceras hygrometricum]|uniref:Uncharacterized protein n=1 Tax=Dorcoceras hygrometricum TaxID=472368 RepID=A0A2Z6ZRD7_9LAMI|nr:hypothetical protein F511_47704 [Dorcoceras hygrometricum]
MQDFSGYIIGWFDFVQIVRALEGDVSLDDLNEGIKSGHNGMFSSSGTSESDSGSYPDLKRFRKGGTGMSSQEFSSSEHGYTGELALSQEIRSNPASRTRSP